LHLASLLLPLVSWFILDLLFFLANDANAAAVQLLEGWFDAKSQTGKMIAGTRFCSSIFVLVSILLQLHSCKLPQDVENVA
jgi:hypothetical protein